jgi:hypothetical protein
VVADCLVVNPSRSPGWFILLATFLLGGLPPLVMSVAGVSSLALGLVLYLLVLLPFLFRYSRALLNPNRYFLAFSGAVFFYFCFQFIYHDGFNLKSYLSVPLLALLIAVAYLSAIKVEDIPSRPLQKTLRYLVFLLFFIGFLNVAVDLRFMGYVHPSAVVPFAEPSHFALFSGGFFIALFVLTKNSAIRIGVISGAFLLAVSFPNMTMLVSVFLMLSLIIKIRPVHFVFAVLGLTAVTSMAAFNPYFSDRLKISDVRNANLSVLVYLQGATDAYNAIINTHGIGLGYQMLGTQPPSRISAKIAEKLGSKDATLNREDGGFLAAKIVAEFGFLGVIFVSIYMFIFFRSFFFLRKVMDGSAKRYDTKFIFANVILFGFVTELFIRGYGYFSPGVFLFFMAMIYFLRNAKDEKLTRISRLSQLVMRRCPEGAMN